MGAAEILHTLTDQGFTLAAAGGRLTVNPSSKLTDAMRAEIRAHKPELVELLTQAANDWPDSLKELERLNGELRRKIDHAHLAARAEAIGNDLERRLIEGSEALAKPPAAQARHYFWLIRAEHEVFDYWACPPETRAEVEARYPGAEVEVLEEEGNADE